MGVPQGPGDARGLGLLVGEAADGGHGAVRAGRTQLARMGPPAALGQHGVGHGQDLGRRPVVVLQADHAGRGVTVGQAFEEGGVGPVPGVDGLIGITDHAEVEAVAQPGLQQPELGRVDVLELVDEQVPVAPAQAGGELRVLLDGRGAGQEQVVEVDQATLLVVGLVGLVEGGHLRGGQG